MATVATILDDIDDKFCQCCLCFKQYKDPRQLPCLHRYCSRCLDEEIERANGDLKCPLCQQEADVPEDGAQGLKTDFFMNEIIEFLDIKKSFQDEETHKCGDCSKVVKARSYCFKCSEFLCEGCHEYHMTLKSLDEHRSYLLTLNDVKSKNLNLKKLSSLKQAPMCKTHQDLSRLCCTTCENMPVCTACTYGGHKFHEIEDAISLATVKKEDMRNQLAILTKSKDKIKLQVEKTLQLQRDVVATAETKIAKLDHDAGEVLDRIDQDLKAVHEEHSNASQQIRNKFEGELERRHQTLEDEIKRIRKEQEEMKQKFKDDLDASIRKSNETYSRKESKLLSERENVEKQLQEGKVLIGKKKGNKLEETEGAIVNGKGTIERIQNLIETGSNLLVSENNWTAIQNVDSVCAASVPLIRASEGGFPEMNEVLEYPHVSFSTGRALKMKISDRPVIEVAIEDIKSKGWFINGVAAAPDGTVVISGGVNGQTQAHISVIKLDGKILKQKLIKSNENNTLCACAHFRDEEFVIATYCNANIGLNNVDNDAYHFTDLRKVINKEVQVWSITADGSNDQIIVGCVNDPVLYVLNGKLQLIRTINLQQIIKYPRDIVVNNGTIFICCQNNKSVYAVNMEGGLLHELPKPASTNGTIPYSVCTSNNGSVYVLWIERECTVDQECVLAQYNPDDGSLLTTTPVRAVQGWLAVSELDGVEKLILPSQHGGMLHVYGLEEDQ